MGKDHNIVSDKKKFNPSLLKRIIGLLSIIRRKQEIRDFLVYDMEWSPRTMEIRIIGVYDGNEFRHYSTVLSFLAGELTSYNRGKWFYAHAGGLADVQYVLDAIYTARSHGDLRYSVKACFSGSSAIIVHVIRGKNAWHFIDSYWLLRDKLKNIGQWIGFSKGGVDESDDPDEPGLSEDEFLRRSNVKRDWFESVDMATLFTYNQRDCVILYKAIQAFQVILLQLGGQLQMTLASSAMQLFRRKFLHADIETGKAVNIEARLAYTASRVEWIEKHVNDAFYYDINSSFPYAMTQPCPGWYLGKDRKLDDLTLSIVHATIEVLPSFLGPIPIRLNSRVFFPSGTWTGHFSSIDINLLLSTGGKIIKLHDVMHFAPFDDLSAYANTIYAKRVAANTEFEKTAYKLLLNSLYGKFAESPVKRGLSIDPIKLTPRMEMLTPGVFIESREIPIPHMHVPIAVHITAFARKTIFDFMSKCGDVHYCDTDGFSTTEILGTSKALGGLKLEKRYDTGHFVGPKFYELQGEEMQRDGTWKPIHLLKAKGFSRMSVERWHAIEQGNNIQFERMARIREIFCRPNSSDPSTPINTHPRSVIVDKGSHFVDFHSSNPIFDPAIHVIPKRFPYLDGTTRPWNVNELKTLLNHD